MAYVGILGHGTVGSGVVEVLMKNADSIAKRAGERIVVKRVLDLREFPELSYSGLFTKRFEDILEDPEIKVVAEMMGGLKPAYDFVSRAMEAGKHVVTSNKELVSTYGPELTQTAQRMGVRFMFEASVGGGIPIIRPLSQCLSANRVSEIQGILNGTTNYILTRMGNEGLDYHTVLADAQKLGYAEKDPTNDVEGFDSTRKIAILASIAFQKFIDYRQIDTEGITKIEMEDIEGAKAFGMNIKLIGSARMDESGEITARVSPCLVPQSYPLAGIFDVFNGVLVKGDAVGDVMFYGRGAGELPTASAVVADIIDIVKKSDFKAPILPVETQDIVPDTEAASFFVRSAKPVEEVTAALGECDMAEFEGWTAYITQPMTEEELLQKGEGLELSMPIRVITEE